MTEENLPNLKLLEVMAKEYATCCERDDMDNAKALFHSFLGIVQKDLEKQAADPAFIVHLIRETESDDPMRVMPAVYLLNYFQEKGLLTWRTK
jgi:hypothetical protein|tara:strand:- start:388 stop:666 length:279 start_codon:yes stop_codon:yes gene_type:complete